MRKLILSLIVLSAVSQAAPRLKSPDHLTKEMFDNTTWDYSYDNYHHGWITVFSDGTYVSKHDRNDGCYHTGDWRVDTKNNTFVIVESVNGRDGYLPRISSAPPEYNFRFSVKGFPTLEGTSHITNADFGIGIRVKFSNPRKGTSHFTMAKQSGS